MTPDFRDDPFVASNPENLPFWQAAEEGRLLGKRCTDCGRHHWYPRCICPFCGSANTAWVPLSGRGSIHAFSTLRRASPPYTVAYVELASLKARIDTLLAGNVKLDGYSRAHLLESSKRIEKVLDAKLSLTAP